MERLNWGHTTSDARSRNYHHYRLPYRSPLTTAQHHHHHRCHQPLTASSPLSPVVLSADCCVIPSSMVLGVTTALAGSRDVHHALQIYRYAPYIQQHSARWQNTCFAHHPQSRWVQHHRRPIHSWMGTRDGTERTQQSPPMQALSRSRSVSDRVVPCWGLSLDPSALIPSCLKHNNQPWN
jgi:hypothetical protein